MKGITKRIACFGVFLLLIGITFTPVISSCTVKCFKTSYQLREKSATAEVVVREYNGDGTYKEIKKKLTVEKIEELKEKVLNAKNFEERLEILKEYNLVSKDASVQKYREKIKKLAEKLDINEEKLSRLSKMLKLYFKTHGLNFDCAYGGYLLGSPYIFCDTTDGGFTFPVGTSFISGLLLVFFLMCAPPGLDLFDTLLMKNGSVIIAKEGGHYDSKWIEGRWVTVSMLGFVGTSIMLPFISPSWFPGILMEGNSLLSIAFTFSSTK